MKNETGVRLENAISFWVEKEAELKKIFRPDIDKERYFLQEKLRYFSDVRDKYKNSLSQSDKISFNMLNGEIKKLERHLYPNIVQRVIAQIGRNIQKFFEDRRSARQVIHQTNVPLTFTRRAKQQQVNSVSKEAAQHLKSGLRHQAGQAQEQKLQQPNGVNLQSSKQSNSENRLRKALNSGEPNLKSESKLGKRSHRHRLQ